MLTNNKYDRLCKIARKALNCSDFKYKVGSVIFKKSRIISSGFNLSKKTHPWLKRIFKHSTIHSEVMSVLKVIHFSDMLKDSDIFVYREAKVNGAIVPRMAKPCAMCVTVLYEVGINRAFWSTNISGFIDCAKVSDLYKNIDKKELFLNNCKPGTVN